MSVRDVGGECEAYPMLEREHPYQKPSWTSNRVRRGFLPSKGILWERKHMAETGLSRLSSILEFELKHDGDLSKCLTRGEGVSAVVNEQDPPKSIRSQTSLQ